MTTIRSRTPRLTKALDYLAESELLVVEQGDDLADASFLEELAAVLNQDGGRCIVIKDTELDKLRQLLWGTP